MTAIQGARYSAPAGGYQVTTTGGSTSSATGTLQPLAHFSPQQGPFQYVASGPAAAHNSGYQSASSLQQRPTCVHGIAYSQVLQPSLQVSSPAAQYHLTQHRGLPQPGSVPSYSLLPSTAPTPERRPNPPSYSSQEEAFTSVQGVQGTAPQAAGRQWCATTFP